MEDRMVKEARQDDIGLLQEVGLVIIGRNEGERLRDCLSSLAAVAVPRVYVDSASTDDSVSLARELAVDVVELSANEPLSAARARNAGFEYLADHYPHLQYIQFIDGDCILEKGWLDTAVLQLGDNPGAAVVYGRRREKYPDRNVFNRLCDMEWDGPDGLVESCGGDFMVRASVFARSGGFNAGFIAGEETELCHRLRKSGWSVLRVDKPMTVHDADISSLGQYLRRCMRYGHACAQGAITYAEAGERFQLRQLLRIVLWTLVLPVAVALLAPGPVVGICILLGLYGLLWFRISRAKAREVTLAPAEAFLFGGFVILARFAELRGVIDYSLKRLAGAVPTIIEYKRS